MEIAILTLCVLISFGIISVIDNQMKVTRNQKLMANNQKIIEMGIDDVLKKLKQK